MGAFTTWLNGLTSKTTPVAADELYLRDSEDSGASKKLTWTNVKATLKTYFDTLYQATLVSGTNIKTINSTSLLGSGDLAVSAAPGGSTTQVQYNNAGAFGGNSGFTYNGTNAITVARLLTTDGSASAPNIQGTTNAAGIYFSGDNTRISQGSTTRAIFTSQRLWVTTTGGFRFASTNSDPTGSATAGVGYDDTNDRVSIDNGTIGTNRNLAVRSIIGTGNLATGIVAKSADYTATANDGTIEVDASGAARTITLPAVASTGGRIYIVKKTDSSGNAVTVDANASETIDGATTVSLASQYSTIIIQANTAGTAWLKLAGI